MPHNPTEGCLFHLLQRCRISGRGVSVSLCVDVRVHVCVDVCLLCDSLCLHVSFCVSVSVCVSLYVSVCVCHRWRRYEEAMSCQRRGSHRLPHLPGCVRLLGGRFHLHPLPLLSAPAPLFPPGRSSLLPMTHSVGGTSRTLSHRRPHRELGRLPPEPQHREFRSQGLGTKITK